MNLHSSHIHRHKRHGVVAEDVDDFHGHGVAAGIGVGMRRGGEFQIAVLAGAEALPFVFEDETAGPAFLVLQFTTPLPSRAGGGDFGNSGCSAMDHHCLIVFINYRPSLSKR